MHTTDETGVACAPLRLPRAVPSAAGANILSTPCSARIIHPAVIGCQVKNYLTAGPSKVAFGDLLRVRRTDPFHRGCVTSRNKVWTRPLAQRILARRSSQGGILPVTFFVGAVNRLLFAVIRVPDSAWPGLVGVAPCSAASTVLYPTDCRQHYLKLEAEDNQPILRLSA